MEYLDKILEIAQKLDTLIAALLLCIPLAMSAFSKAQELRTEAEERRKKGLLDMVPWIVRKGHEAFASYRMFKGKSHPEKRKYLEDVIVAAHARHNGESAISRSEVEAVLAKAETYWKENKLALKAELAADPSNNLPPLPGVEVDMSSDIATLPPIGDPVPPSPGPGQPSEE
jgi:hypothetical protein